MNIMTISICNRCYNPISFNNVSKDYFGTCITHDEDLFKIETLDDNFIEIIDACGDYNEENVTTFFNAHLSRTELVPQLAETILNANDNAGWMLPNDGFIRQTYLYVNQQKDMFINFHDNDNDYGGSTEDAALRIDDNFKKSKLAFEQLSTRFNLSDQLLKTTFTLSDDGEKVESYENDIFIPLTLFNGLDTPKSIADFLMS